MPASSLRWRYFATWIVTVKPAPLKILCRVLGRMYRLVCTSDACCKAVGQVLSSVVSSCGKDVIVAQALQIYAPLGHALGMRRLMAELEDICFQVIPFSYGSSSGRRCVTNIQGTAGCSFWFAVC